MANSALIRWARSCIMPKPTCSPEGRFDRCSLLKPAVVTNRHDKIAVVVISTLHVCARVLRNIGQAFLQVKMTANAHRNSKPARRPAILNQLEYRFVVQNAPAAILPLQENLYY